MYEPHDVTLQLDGVGRELPGPLKRSRRRTRPAGFTGGPGGPGRRGPGQDGAGQGATGEGGQELGDGTAQGIPEGPVFVDESGRRSRKYRRVGWILGIACTCYAVMLVVTVVGGNSSAPWLLIPGPASAKKADTVKEPSATDASPVRSDVLPGTTVGPGPVDVVSTDVPKPRTTISNGVRVTVPPKPGKKPKPAAPGKPAAASQAPGSDGSADPAPVTTPTAGAGEPSPVDSPSPDPTTSAPAPPEQSAPPEAAPAPQKAHRRR
ncbi:hypothetical protein [Streptomyces sp. NBC_00344]|uniref:hypothetical protein n=1 Tax=Streptomyces sp. NBC_00344 TaxID=2975720 RepID=UPI002E1B9B6D